MDSLILASKSPRRREILKRLEIPFLSYDVHVDENVHYGKFVRSSVINISKRKATAAAGAFSRGLVVGVDTVVRFNGKVFGKPKDENEALLFLRMLSGNQHLVLSGITVKNVESGVSCSSCSTTSVWFIKLSSREIQRYVDGGEWMDKAGGYAIQGQAALYVEKIVGSYYNIMGLPVEELYKLLKRFSYWESNGLYHPIRKLSYCVEKI